MKTINGKKYKTLADLKRKLMKNKKFRDEYNSHRLEFAIVDGLIRARNQKNMTQKQIARKAGVHQSAIARFESGKSGATLSFTEKLAHAIGVKIRIGV